MTRTHRATRTSAQQSRMPPIARAWPVTPNTTGAGNP